MCSSDLQISKNVGKNVGIRVGDPVLKNLVAGSGWGPERRHATKLGLKKMLFRGYLPGGPGMPTKSLKYPCMEIWLDLTVCSGASEAGLLKERKSYTKILEKFQKNQLKLLFTLIIIWIILVVQLFSITKTKQKYMRKKI